MIIGIGGASRSGKSQLASEMANYIHENGTSVKILSLDDYVFEKEQLPRIGDQINWEIPEAYDLDRLLSDIKKYKGGYEFLICEGLLIFWKQSIRDLFDYKVFIQIPRDLFYLRKLEDDRWGAIPLWYMDHIWMSYLQYGLPDHLDNYLVIDATNPSTSTVLIELITTQNKKG